MDHTHHTMYALFHDVLVSASIYTWWIVMETYILPWVVVKQVWKPLLVALFKLYSEGVLKNSCDIWYEVSQKHQDVKAECGPMRTVSPMARVSPKLTLSFTLGWLRWTLPSNRWPDTHPWEADSLLGSKIHALTITESKGCLAHLEKGRGRSHLWL